MAAAAYISFTGVTGIEGGSFMMERGVAPSAGEITCVPQHISSSVGTLEIRYVHDIVNHLPPDDVLAAPYSVISSVAVEGSGGATMMKLTILDFRYWWQFSHIDGEYNKPGPGGSLIAEKTLRELMQLCLSALPYATNYDLSQVDPAPRPHVDWRGDRADLSLEELMSDFGYTLVVRASGVIAVVPIGVGQPLPQLGAEVTASFSAAGGALPAQVRIALGDIRYQMKFELEAVGEDTDGIVKPIGDLSYKPAHGWTEFAIPDFENVEGTYDNDGMQTPKADLASKSVYRWYRIKKPVHTSRNFAPPGFLGTNDDGEVAPATAAQCDEIDKLKYLLPILPELNSSAGYVDGEEPKFAKAKITGVFYNEEGLDANTHKGALCPCDFSVDADTGIVKFNDFVYALFPNPIGSFLPIPVSGDGQAGFVVPADLVLTCTVHVTLPTLNKKQYYAYTFPAGGAVGVKTVDHTELEPLVTASYGGADGKSVTGISYNTDLQAKAAFYAAAEIARMTPQNGCVVEYQGIRLIELDGVRSQVEWRVGYGQASRTKASYGVEINAFVPTYKEYMELQRRKLTEARSRRDHRKLTKNLQTQWAS